MSARRPKNGKPPKSPKGSAAFSCAREPMLLVCAQLWIQGVAQAVLDAGGTWRTSYVLEFDPEDGNALKRLFTGKRRPDAVVCRNDALAARLIRELTDLQVDIPQAVRIAGFDDATFARSLTPPLTSIRQPVARIAETATQALLDRIRKPETPPKSILFDADLICRASTVGHVKA